jgi:hypothetical protein
MARRSRPKQPLDWTDVKSRDGAEVIGSYAIDGGMIIVRSAEGWEKRTGKSGAGENENLARIILSEPPPR